ncbi:MAG: 50S ribosomal protein L17 [Lentisphaerae bacterium]|nr:50S ribosomal protein L17 [Lentisphaerota bacterium]
MRHLKHTAKLGRNCGHRKALLVNLACSILEHEQVKTTVTRAKEVRILVDKLITLGKAGTPHARRLAAARMKINTEAGKLQSKKMVLDKLFSDLAQRYATRNGGYTRIIRIGHRIGDAAEACLIQLVEAAPAAEEAKAE